MSFGSGVAAYEMGRPEYLPEHVAWMLDGVHGRVLDLAAGSGKLTRMLTRLGFEVVAVDPDEQMLARNTGVPSYLGRADSIPLAAGAVAAVCVGQAWHWFDPLTAAAEIARVLVPGGRLGLIWNTRDVSQAFVEQLVAVMGVSPAEQMVDCGAVAEVAGFTPFTRSRQEQVRVMTPSELVAMVASRSNYLTAVPEQQDLIMSRLHSLIESHPHTRGRERFEYPLHSTVYRAERLP